MRVDTEKKVFVCPYCDTVEPFEGLSNQALKEELKGIVSEAIRDAASRSGEQGKGGGSAGNQKDAWSGARKGAQKVKESLVSIMQIIFCIFLMFFSVAMFTEYRAVGFISLLQLILLITALVCKARFRRTGREKDRRIARVSVIIASLLIIVWFAVLLSEDAGGGSGLGAQNYKWPETGLGSQLPVLPGSLDTCYSNKSGFSADSKGNEITDFAKYVADCKKVGYTIDPVETEYSYLAYDENDNKLEIRFSNYSGRIDVSLDKGIVMTDFQWYSQGIAGELPVPKAAQSYLKALNNDTYERFEIYVGDLTREEYNAYVNQCMEAGFSGRLDETGIFRGKKERSSSDEKAGGKKTYVRVTLEFQRERILYIEAYSSEY